MRPEGFQRICYLRRTLPKVVYESGTSPYQEYLILGDQESDELSLTETVVAPVGSHVATDGSGQVSLDGKILKLPNVDPHTTQAGALSFSPDGAHFAFALHSRGGQTLYLDGVAQSAYTVGGGSAGASNALYSFSPDSKCIAYFAGSRAPQLALSKDFASTTSTCELDRPLITQI
jgi:hypothetical protein